MMLSGKWLGWSGAAEPNGRLWQNQPKSDNPPMGLANQSCCCYSEVQQISVWNMDNKLRVASSSGLTIRSIIGLGLMLFLASCRSSGPDGVFSGILPEKKATQPVSSGEAVPGTNPNSKSTLANVQNPLTDYCPAVRIRAGTESYRIYSGRDRSDDNKVRYQATLTKVARECAYVGENLEIRVGALGRIITGPSGAPGSFDMPIRVAVQEGGCTRHFQLHQLEGTIPSGLTYSKFEFVDDTIVMPAPKATNVRIFVGFDETPDASSSADACQS